MGCNEYTKDQLCILAMAATPGLGSATINKLVRTAQHREQPLRLFMRLDHGELNRRYGISPHIARSLSALENPFARASEVLGLLERANVHPVFRDDPTYPEKLTRYLQTSVPPVLFIGGDERMLARPCVAIVGSRKPSARARQAAYNFAQQMASSGTVIVSGGARGIDTAGHQGAILTGATAVVPPKGIVNFRWERIDRSAHAPDSLCIIGQFPPRDRWRTRNALQRNQTIVALSDAVVGFEPRDRGGTWRSCCAALRMCKPLFVVTASADAAQSRGRAHLVRSGAVALDPAQMPLPPQFMKLMQEYSPARPFQTALFEAKEKQD
jgi:DNA processing protein